MKFCIVALGFDPGAFTTLLTDPENIENRGLGCSRPDAVEAVGADDEEEGADDEAPWDNKGWWALMLLLLIEGEMREEGKGRASGPT